jgi:transcriptional regulator with XRE-family HTH domain
MVFREIGKRIQQAREEDGITQEELAARLGCTQSALSNYELGKRRLYLNLLNQIARVLNRPLEYFMETSADEGEQGDGDAATLLSDPLLKEILVAASKLPGHERKLVLDYINWREAHK